MGDNPVELAKQDELTNHINNKNNPHEVKSSQVTIGDSISNDLGIATGSNVDDALATLNNTFDMINDSINGTGQNVTYWKMYEDETVYDSPSIYTIGNDDEVYASIYSDIKYNRDTGEYDLINCIVNNERFKASTNADYRFEMYPNKYARIRNINTVYYLTENVDSVVELYSGSGGTITRILFVLKNVQTFSHKFKYIGSTTDSDPSKYPNNAYSGDIYYIRQDGLSLTISKTMYSSLTTTSATTAEIICEFSPKILILQQTNGNPVFFWLYNSRYLSYGTIRGASVNYNPSNKTINLSNLGNSLLNKTFNVVVIG